MNKNNLNRIKGILSAKQGTQIPKFQKGYSIYHKSTNQPIYSKDGISWFTDEDYMSPFTGNLDEFTEPELGQQFYTKNPNVIIQNQRENIPIINTLQPKSVSLNTTISPNISTRDLESANKDAMEASAGIQLSEEDQKLSDQMTQRKVNIAQGISTGIQSIGNVFGANQSATDSQLTKNIDTVYNGISSAVSNMGPVGQVAGMVMNTLGAIGNISQAMGGGTDQQTKLDSWMDSPLLSWNVGAINGFFGKNTDSFGIDQETLQQVGSSYGGTATNINEAAKSADKEYGLFSGKARKKANDVINKAKSQQNLMSNIADQASNQRLAVQSMGEQAGIAYSMMTDGGYNQKYTYAAKQGGVIEWEPDIKLEWKPQIKLNWELPEFKEGGNINITEELEWIPELQKGDKIRTLEELIEYAKKENPRFIQRLSEEPRGIKFINDEGKEGEGNVYLEWSTDSKGNAIIYPRIQEFEDGTLKFLSSNEAYNRAIDNNNVLIMSPEEAEIFFASDEEYQTAYKRGWPAMFKSSIWKHKQGGSVKESDVPEIEETNQKNVIPEGALHKNKHHMEHAEGLTKKGIPVIDEEGEQQAEIEHSEIIFTLEVTKKLEEYYQIFYSEESSNKEKEQVALDAGKLLVYQILENTEDRTGLIDSCKKGGILTHKISNDSIKEISEWIPNIVIIEKEFEKNPKNKEKSEKDNIKDIIKEVLIEILTNK